MKEIRIWDGSMGPLMEKHLQLREAVGRVNQADTSALSCFNRFLKQKYPKIKTLNRMVILDFLRTKENLKVGGRRNYIIHIRQFCRFLVQRGIPCYVPDKTLMPKYVYKPRYYPLTEIQVKDFMKFARTVRSNQPFIGETYAAMLGLLWCTGMRRKEVVRLTHQDVDLETGVLFIRQTKFHKDRLVPLSKSVVKALFKYQELKSSRGYSIAKKLPFFVTLAGKQMPGHSLSTVFIRIVERMKLANIEGRRPALHAFRHNFATQKMAQFFSDPEKYPPSPYMARLSTYLGHTNIFFTQYYLHPDFNLLQQASTKFEF